jgi:hypothetical protein
MKTKLTFFTKLTIVGLVALAIALWTQWLSGDPAYTRFPPGPVLFIAVAGIIVAGARWWWTPLMGALISLLVTSGWIARFPAAVLRLTHPSLVGKFAAGIFIGALLQIVALVVTDVAGLVATVQNFRHRGTTSDSAKMACRLFGGLFVLMGILVIVGGVRGDRYHNLMHLTWGALALGASFMGSRVAKHFCVGSGVFYLTLATLGFLLGNSSMNRAWYLGPMLLHSGDHIFHLVLGSVFLSLGLFSGQSLRFRQVQQARS